MEYIKFKQQKIVSKDYSDYIDRFNSVSLAGWLQRYIFFESVQVISVYTVSVIINTDKS